MPPDQQAAGKEAPRRSVPRSTFGEWKPASQRDPLGLLAEQERHRIPELLPLRHARMLASPFAFYRGTAVIMAADLASLPVTGLGVQACGDAHIQNFGAFATPERNVVFDVNDFDETLPGPWEWDVLRMAGSIVLAARDRAFSSRLAECAVLDGIGAYRKTMVRLAAAPVLAVWYHRVDMSDVIRGARPPARRALGRALARAGKRTAENLLPRLTHGADVHFIDDPPTFARVGLEGASADQTRAVLDAYRDTLAPPVRILFDRFELHDIAHKVVGVGSVGTVCLVALLLTQRGEPLFLQVKEAQASVLEPYVGRSHFKNNGERVVHGQRIMQTASDIFLGWTEIEGTDYYVRQLRDMKMSVSLTTISPIDLTQYAQLCGWTLARAHARSGDPLAIAQYMGKSTTFERSVARFAQTYADVAAADYALFARSQR
jgi:uncharacterized protein (DUF2252 family)